MNTSESPDMAEIEDIVQRVVERQQADTSAKERNRRRQGKMRRRQKERRQMLRSIEVIKWAMLGSVSLSLISMIGVIWTGYQANRTVNLVEHEIQQFRDTVYNPVENMASALGRQIDEKIEAYLDANPSDEVKK